MPTLDDLMELAEGLISFLVKRCLEKRRCGSSESSDATSPSWRRSKRPSRALRTTRPFKMLAGSASPRASWKQNSSGAETSARLTKPTSHRNSISPLMIHRYPAQVKAFYMEPDPQRPDLALCVDVLAPEGYGEIIGGSQRMASYDLLLQRIHEHNLPEEAFKWYLDLRKFGSVPHGGFGMGIERAVAWICGLEHVRETIPFPRMLNRLYP